MKKAFSLLILGLALTGAVFLFWWPRPDLSFVRTPNVAVHDALEQVAATTEISAPPPLRLVRQAPNAQLSLEGVLKATNKAREENGELPALTLNANLSQAAEAKLQDMFAKQYFEHTAPDGTGPGDLATTAAYRYLLVGENLAQGNFENDQALVDAWMASPGHRENILREGYRDIGLAVGRGTFEGHTTWLAVQEFGRPRTACAEPDTALQKQIDNNKTRIDELKAEADQLKTELDASRPNNQEEVTAHNQKVATYNKVVDELNALIKAVQGQVTIYNGSVQAFNTCAKSDH